MVEEDVYCIDVIQQVDAAVGLLVSAKKTLLSGHLVHCLTDKLKEDKGRTIDELLKVYNAGH
jgi:DNA-binding FrmR family transcriptional regulator